MSAVETPVSVRESLIRRWCRGALVRAVRRDAECGGVWGEAVLAEFDDAVMTDAEAARWAAGGLLVSWRERSDGRGVVGALVGWLFGGGWVRRSVVGAVLASAALFAVQQWVVGVVHVPSVALQPAVNAGDRVLVDRVTFRVAGVDAGDIVLLAPAGDGRVLRVAGLPGDQITCRQSVVYRNGEPLPEPYLPAGTATDCAAVKVPAGHVYLLGDNRSSAFDSRHEGPFAIDSIAGLLITRVLTASNPLD